ncbi:MAG: cytochrome c maturation protein CcmE [Myxococcales bacterium]|nr:cytochrome c maturation protein CcmE [Myxococcales bacterium]MCB9522112.1 cytochrome c maturation protein CcmE [Myxococcales bacterium]
MSDETLRDEGPSTGSRIRLIVGVLLGVAAFYVVVDSMTEGGTYFYTVEEAAGQEVNDRPIRVKGKVMPGTWKQNDKGNEHAFTIYENDKRMKVTYLGALPDVFGEDREVVATGTRGEDGVLVATEVTAKCPSKYEGEAMSESARERVGHPGS